MVTANHLSIIIRENFSDSLVAFESSIAIESSRNEALLRLLLDNVSKFDAHVKSAQKDRSETNCSFSNKQISYIYPKAAPC